MNIPEWAVKAAAKIETEGLEMGIRSGLTRPQLAFIIAQHAPKDETEAAHVFAVKHHLENSEQMYPASVICAQLSAELTDARERVSELRKKDDWIAVLLRIIKRTVINQATGCWEWMGSVKKKNDPNNQYGTVLVGSRTDETRRPESVHRVSFLAFHGEIPSGRMICHTCDNQKCWNPSHLYAGTAQDNANDKRKRGRVHRSIGEKNGRAKLDWNQVREIRALRGIRTHLWIANKYGVSPSVVGDILLNKKWCENPKPRRRSEAL